MGLGRKEGVIVEGREVFAVVTWVLVICGDWRGRREAFGEGLMGGRGGRRKVFAVVSLGFS